jgi:curli biogenesis system outer membrane secretion channel CsgG
MGSGIVCAVVLPTVLAVGVVFLCGCEKLDLAIETTPATIGSSTAAHSDLTSLPEPQEKIVVATYRFRDQTGQYKPSAGVATTFSTAVTQGATAMLNKALEDSGWFVPIERESLANLLNERQIIRSSRMQYQSETGEKLPDVPPLLYAGVLIEGGIIGYDTDYITTASGVRYFGVGGSGKLRKDRVDIYLRIVSVQNGEILKSVATTKSVLSKEVSFGIYRYVSIKKLLEVETGLSTNEPTTMCVLEAIEKGVHDLIAEGIMDGLWALKNPEDINSPSIQSYLEETGRTTEVTTPGRRGRLIKEAGPPTLEPGAPEPKESKPVSDFLKDVIGEPGSKGVEESAPQMIEEPKPESEGAEKSESEDVGKPESGAPKTDGPKSTLESLQEVIGKPRSEDVEEPASEIIEEPKPQVSEPGSGDAEESESEGVEESGSKSGEESESEGS